MVAVGFPVSFKAVIKDTEAAAVTFVGPLWDSLRRTTTSNDFTPRTCILRSIDGADISPPYAQREAKNIGRFVRIVRCVVL